MTSYSNEEAEVDVVNKTPAEARAVKCVNKFMEASKKYTDRLFDKFFILYEEYLSTRSQRRTALQRANLKPPYAFTIIETYTPYVVEAFLADKPYIGIRGRGPEDQQYESLLEQYLSFQFDEMGFLPKFIPFVKSLLLFGTAIAKVTWKYETKMVMQEVPSTNPLEPPKKVRVRDTTYDNPNFDPISIFDFFPDPYASVPGDIQSMRGCVHRVWRTFSELKSKEKKTLANGVEIGIYKNLDLIEKELNSEEGEIKTDGYDTHLSKREQLYDIPGDVKRKDKLEIWEYWGLHDPKGDGNYEEYVITIVNGKYCIREESNPLDYQFKPFVASVNYPIEGEFYGIGEIEPVWSLLKEGTALKNARLDQVNQAVNRMWLVDRSAGINVRNLYTRAGGIVLANDINGIKALDPSEVVGSSFRELSEIDYGIQQAVALPNPSAGVSKIGSGYGRTATGVNYLSNLTSSRLSLKIRLLSQMAFNNIARIMLMLNKQFNEDVWVRVMNNDPNPFKLLPASAFACQYDFIVDSAVDRLSKKDRQSNFQQNIVPMLQMAEQYRPGLVRWEQVIPDTLKDFEYRNVDKYVTSPEEQQKFQQGMADQEMQKAKMNADAQAEAQAKLIMLKGQIESQIHADKEENQTTREMVKSFVGASSKSAGSAA